MTYVKFPPTPVFDKALKDAGDYFSFLDEYFDDEMNPLPGTPEELVKELDLLVEDSGDTRVDCE